MKMIIAYIAPFKLDEVVLSVFELQRWSADGFKIGFAAGLKGDPDIVQAFEARLQAAHINPAHITLSPAQPTDDFWTRYREIDLILDTYPFNGGTTSCYSAYAGVPLLTLSGQSLISRVGRSVVCNLGFASLAVDSYEQYVQRALELVNDGALLAALLTVVFARQVLPALAPFVLGFVLWQKIGRAHV